MGCLFKNCRSLCSPLLVALMVFLAAITTTGQLCADDSPLADERGSRSRRQAKSIEASIAMYNQATAPNSVKQQQALSVDSLQEVDNSNMESIAFHEIPVPPVKRKRSLHTKLLDSYPMVMEWIEPLLDDTDEDPKIIGIGWNSSRPGKAALNIRPFHSWKGAAPSLQKLVISGKLIGSQEDLRACYPLSDSTVAEVVQNDGNSSIRIKFSGSF